MTSSTAVLTRPDSAPSTVRVGMRLRLHLTARSAGTLVTGLLACVALASWLTTLALAALSLFTPLLRPVTAWVRSICGAERRWVASETASSPYRPQEGGTFRRAWIIATDPASWRDVLWLAWQSVVGFTMAAVSVSLLLGTLFYLAYPFLYSVTPSNVFRQPFGPWSHLHSVVQSCALMPIGIVYFALWYVTVLPIARAEVAVGRSLLRP